MEDATFNAEFAQCRFRYNALKEQVANAIETYSHLVDTEGPNIETQVHGRLGEGRGDRRTGRVRRDAGGP